MQIVLRMEGDGIPRLSTAIRNLGRKRAYTAYRRALNTAGQKTFTQVRRAVAKQMGVPQKDVVKYGGMRRIPAMGEELQTTIIARGGYLPTKLFGARQTAKGVSAKPWGTRRTFPRTFIVASLGGHVFSRAEGVPRLPIEKHYGPAVPKEMVRGESLKAFYATAPAVLEHEVNRQIRLLGAGVIR